jgi:hypothetical protein
MYSSQLNPEHLKTESQYMSQGNQQPALRIHPIPRGPIAPPAPVRVPVVAGLSRDDRLQVATAILAFRRFVEQQNAALITAVDALNTNIQNIIA